MKDKTILAFAGRSHHIHRLSSVLGYLSSQGANAVWLTSDNAINIDPNTVSLTKYDQRFAFAYGFMNTENIASVDKMSRMLLQRWFHSDNSLQHYVSPYWAAYTMREAAEVIASFRSALAEIKPDVTIILHFNNFWCSALAYVSHELGIPCVATQEGLLRHRDQVTQGKQSMAANYCERLLVWSNSAKKAYIAAGIPEHKVKVVGIAHLDAWLMKQRDDEEAFRQWQVNYKLSLGFSLNKPVVTFAPPQLSRYEGDPIKAINTLSQWTSQTLLPVALKMHPFEAANTVQNLRNMLRNNPYIKVVWDDKGILPMVSISDAFITQHSSTALEALAMDVPLIEIDLDNAGITQSWQEQGLVAHALTSQDDFGKLVDILTGKLRANEHKIKAWKAENLGRLDGKVAHRIGRQLNGLL